ncbi:sensor histidine kinase [Dactylosporangium sp. CA-139066]|uniref:sensor histidine kinase n=1 Tax=Dactylosporangium sp. CA-139066 TaxID=3239930 RepID=UPI003D92945C
MWAISSSSTSRRLVAAWAALAIVCAIAMYTVPGRETVAFHLIWIGLAVVYGFSRWRASIMVLVLLLVTTVTGAILVHHADAGYIGWEETTEEPLMTALFGVMVWHVHRRNQALAQVRRLAEVERRRLEVQQMFVRLASHELRTPITVARGYTDMVRSAHRDATTLEDTAIVLDELDKLARITERLVTLMQIEEPHPVSTVDLDAELERIGRRWSPTASRHWTVYSDVGWVAASHERLEAAVDCLVENALKFTGPDDTIELSARREAGCWVLTVRDTGAGMAAETLEAVRHGCAGEPTETGTGLGLAIVRAVVGALGGRMHIHSTAGGGTTVQLRIPVTTPEPEPPARSESRNQYPHETSTGAAPR